MSCVCVGHDIFVKRADLFYFLVFPTLGRQKISFRYIRCFLCKIKLTRSLACVQHLLFICGWILFYLRSPNSSCCLPFILNTAAYVKKKNTPRNEDKVGRRDFQPAVRSGVTYFDRKSVTGRCTIGRQRNWLYEGCEVSFSLHPSWLLFKAAIKVFNHSVQSYQLTRDTYTWSCVYRECTKRADPRRLSQRLGWQ